MPKKKVKLCTTCGHGATERTLHQRPKPPPPKKDVHALAREALARVKKGQGR